MTPRSHASGGVELLDSGAGLRRDALCMTALQCQSIRVSGDSEGAFI